MDTAEKKIFSRATFDFCIIDHWFESWIKGLDVLRRLTVGWTYLEQQKW